MPDAIVFLPGLFQQSREQAIDKIAQRLATAMDREAADGDAVFFTRQATTEEFRQAKTRYVRIERKDGRGETPVMDVYELEYTDRLTAAYNKRSPFLQAFTIFILLLSSLPKLIRSFTQKGQSAGHKFHVLYGGGAFFLLTCYLWVLVITAGLTVLDAKNRLQGTSSASGQTALALTNQPGTLTNFATNPTITPDQQQSSEVDWDVLPFFQSIVVIIAAIGLFTKTDLKAILTRISIEMACAVNYINSHDRSGLVLGLLSDLLEHIHEKKNTGQAYDRIILVGYSFGSIVAMDALFGWQPASVRYKSIHTLVTIGCPYYLIRTYWPRYFDRRIVTPGIPQRWMNIFSYGDVLGSNFSSESGDSDDLASKLGTTTIENIQYGPPLQISDYTLLEQLAFVGFKLHGKYWERDEPGDINCFDIIIGHLLSQTPPPAQPSVI